MTFVFAFSREERDFIVEDRETDLLLTEVGMMLVEKLAESDGMFRIQTSEDNANHFLHELKSECVLKAHRIKQGALLTKMAKRLRVLPVEMPD
jgi:hypothetical protein